MHTYRDTSRDYNTRTLQNGHYCNGIKCKVSDTLSFVYTKVTQLGYGHTDWEGRASERRRRRHQANIVVCFSITSECVVCNVWMVFYINK